MAISFNDNPPNDKPTSLNFQLQVEFFSKLLDAWSELRTDPEESWRELAEYTWKTELETREEDIKNKYREVSDKFAIEGRRGQRRMMKNWTGKQLREMAAEVDHAKEYDIFYSDLSSFAHVDIRLLDQFLRLDGGGITWTQRANSHELSHVLNYAAMFLSCILELYGQTFGTWKDEEVEDCWLL